MSNPTPITPADAERPPSLKTLWAVITVLAGLLVWTASTAWDANEKKHSAIKSAADQANADTDRKLAGYVKTETLLEWQRDSERQRLLWEIGHEKQRLLDYRDLQRLLDQRR